MNLIRGILYNFKKNFIQVFSSRNLIWHLIAWVSTYLIVISGFDWWYFRFFQRTLVYRILFPAAIIGGLVPIFVPLVIYWTSKSKKAINTAFALGQAAFMAWVVSSIYKAFTGRLPPDMYGRYTGIDISHIFSFGFFKEGIFWGWPSSHTAVAFATTTALIVLHPYKKMYPLIIFYALYIGIGVSVSIHWFSDFLAGAIIGTVIGLVVGKSFVARLKSVL